MFELMTAQEANAIYQNAQKEKTEQTILNIVNNIKEAIAAEAGSVDISFTDYIQENDSIITAINDIKELGYKVTVFHAQYPYDNYIYKIIVSWENVDNG